MREDDQRWELLAGVLHDDPELIVGVTEAGALLGVSKQRLAQLRASYRDVPPPVAKLACGPIWTNRAIVAFRTRHPRRPPGRPTWGRVPFPALLERSSLGTAEARFLRSLTPQEVIDRIMRLSRTISR